MPTRIIRIIKIFVPLVFSVIFIILLFTSIVSLASTQPADGMAVNVATSTEQLQIPHQIQIVRVYYINQDTLNEIAARMEPWEVNKDSGYAIVEVDATQLAWLIDMGLKVEIDHQLTQEYYNKRPLSTNQTTGIPSYSCYKTVEETYAFAESLIITYPTLAEWIDIGDSWGKNQSGNQGYDLYVLKITNQNTTHAKPKLFVMSGLHAREYTPPELNTYFAEYLLQHYGNDSDITWLLDYHEIHLLLHANPDGRKQAESGKYWRKNTNENYCSPTSDYRGADLNRNFTFHWNNCDGDYCSSGNECYETYRGTFAASEPETQAIQIYLRSIFPDQRGELDTDPAPITSTGVFIDLHSYGNLVLWPWGFTTNTAPNGDALQTLGRKFAFFNQYEPGQASENLYLTDGDSDGFAYGELGLAGYTFEIGSKFFQECSYFQEDVITRNIPALLYAAKIARASYLLPSGPDVLHISITPEFTGNENDLLLKANINDKQYYGIGEPTQIISTAEYYIDTPPWITSTFPISFPMHVEDGAFDEYIETMTSTIETTGLSQGRHTIFVRGQDTAGNWGPVSATFLYISKYNYFFPIGIAQ